MALEAMKILKTPNKEPLAEVHIWLNIELKMRLMAYAKRHKTTLTDVVSSVLTEYLIEVDRTKLCRYTAKYLISEGAKK